jgi:hypothetical protein
MIRSFGKNIAAPLGGGAIGAVNLCSGTVHQL